MSGRSLFDPMLNLNNYCFTVEHSDAMQRELHLLLVAPTDPQPDPVKQQLFRSDIGDNERSQSL